VKSILKTSLANNATLKVVSLILGYSFWSMLSYSHTSTWHTDVPLCFYGNKALAVTGPEKVSISLSGKRVDLHAIDAKALAIHIDAATLHAGPNAIVVDNKSLFLPDAVKLIHYCPNNIVVELPIVT